jgi:DNA-binding response OmpR family regulator
MLVLLVEDDPDARFIYASCLRHAGFEVTEAGSAREGANAAIAKRPDLVVLDRRLPDRDGLDLARQWRTSANGMSRVPIITLTAFTARADVEAALIAGCDAFLAKPCPGDILVAHVHKLLLGTNPTKKIPKVQI